MSGLLAGKVWHSDLSRALKPVAAALADEANDDGTRIYPSIGFLAWKISASERTVQDGMAELRRMGVIEPICHPECVETPGIKHGGTGDPVHYVMHVDRLPERLPWAEERARRRHLRILEREEEGADSAPTQAREGADRDIEGCRSRHERVQPTAPDPSGDPSEDPIDRSLGRHARAVARQVADGKREQAVLEPLRRVYELVAPGSLMPRHVEASLEAWSKLLTPEDARRIEAEVTHEHSGKGWRFAAGFAARVAGARRAGLDPWERPVGGPPAVEAGSPAGPRPAGGVAARRARDRTPALPFAADVELGGFSSEPPPS